MIQSLMHHWERKLSLRDKNRSTLAFDWGFDFLDHDPGSKDPKEALLEFNQKVIQNSSSFFNHSDQDARVSNGPEASVLQFASSIVSPYPQNNVVRAHIYRPKIADQRAVIVLPQWNANATSHVGLCKLLARIGVTAVRLTLPYHEERNPSGPRADYMVSPNLGRTIQAIRQAALDARNIVDWLELQGFHRIGIMGTSVGSCISFLAFVHDPRIRTGVFHHVSSYFGDVVWHGISTQHVRKGIEPHLTETELHHAWAAISPNTYIPKLQTLQERKYLLISARYDLTFPVQFSRLLFDAHDKHGLAYDVSFLPCGHYTSALTPFKHRVGYLVAKYFRRHL